jgi:hypothetical protein
VNNKSLVAAFSATALTLFAGALTSPARAIVTINARPTGDLMMLNVNVVNDTPNQLAVDVYQLDLSGAHATSEVTQLAGFSTGTLQVQFVVPTSNFDASGNPTSLNYIPGIYQFSIFGLPTGIAGPIGYGAPFTYTDSTMEVNIVAVPEPPGGCGSSTSTADGCGDVYTFDHTITISPSAFASQPGSLAQMCFGLPLLGIPFLAYQRRHRLSVKTSPG